MISLRERVEIKASPEQGCDGFVHCREHSLAWHPDRARYAYPGRVLEEGAP
jgi:hypothetical protein